MLAGLAPERSSGRMYLPAAGKDDTQAGGVGDSRSLPAPGSIISGPTEEAHQLCPLLPEEGPEVFGVNGVSLTAGIGFNAPLEVFATPRSQPMTPRRIPQKANRHARAPLRKVYPRRNRRLRLTLGLQHVLDQFVGQSFRADLIGSVGDGLLQPGNFFQTLLIDDSAVESIEWISCALISYRGVVATIHAGL